MAEPTAQMWRTEPPDQAAVDVLAKWLLWLSLIHI